MVTSILARQLLERHGELHPQPPTDWRGEFLIPPAVERFYEEIGPVNVSVESCGIPYLLPSLADLWGRTGQYRWDVSFDSPPNSEKDWSEDWVVVADAGGFEALIFARTSGRILRASLYEERWDPVEVFPDLNTMAGCLGTLGTIIRDAGRSFTDDDDEIRPKYRQEAIDQLALLLGSELGAEAILVHLWEVVRSNPNPPFEQ